MMQFNAFTVMAAAARSMGLDCDPVGDDRILWIRSGNRTLGVRGNNMSCNSILVDRLMLIPPFHLALLKHEGLPVTLIGSLRQAEEQEQLLDAVPEGETVGVYVGKRRARWSFFAGAEGTADLRRRVDDAWRSGVKRVDLIRMPAWRRLRLLTVRGRVTDALESPAGPDTGVARGKPAFRRIEPDSLGTADFEPLRGAARLVGLTIGLFDVLVNGNGRILIAGFSGYVPWRRFCGDGDSLDPVAASRVLTDYFCPLD